MAVDGDMTKPYMAGEVVGDGDIAMTWACDLDVACNAWQGTCDVVGDGYKAGDMAGGGRAMKADNGDVAGNVPMAWGMVGGGDMDYDAEMVGDMVSDGDMAGMGTW